MLRKKNRRKKQEQEHTHLAVRVEHYEARVEGSVNHNIYAPQYAWDLDENEPLYTFETQLVISGLSTYPKERAGDTYELTIYGNDVPSQRLSRTLKDAQARDDNGSPKYREYRGERIPVYNPLPGIALLNKVRGEQHWTVWLHAAPQFLNNALILLGREKMLYLAIHERRVGRTRWAQGVSLQTTDPAEE